MRLAGRALHSFASASRNSSRTRSFELDLYDDSAWVSLVAFHLKDMRPGLGGVLTRLLFRPFANQRFLNVRTYVKREGDTGIYFLAEWLSSRANTMPGPLYDLPFRFGMLNYEHSNANGEVNGEVRGAEGQLSYKCTENTETTPYEATRDSLAAFLLERYIAFTWRNSKRGWFPVWHPTWKFRPVGICIAVCKKDVINGC